jgi:putative membrane protein
MFRTFAFSTGLMAGVFLFGCTEHHHWFHHTESTPTTVTSEYIAPDQTTYTTPVVLTSDRMDRPTLAPLEVQALNDLHRINFVEIQMGRLAKQKGSTADIREFGDRLVNDHQSNDRRVEDIARTYGIVLATPRMDEVEQTANDRMLAASGITFDNLFANSMDNEHTEEIQKFERVQATVRNPDVVALLNDAIPTMRQHEVRANQLNRTP